MAEIENLEPDLEELRESYRSGKTKEASWRKSQLKGLLTLLKEQEKDIFKALEQDLGKHYAESYRDEVGTLTKSVNLALSSLKDWMSSRKAKLPIAAFPSTAEVFPEPLGLVLIISSWNFPFAFRPGSSQLFSSSKTIPTYLDKKAVKVIEGGAAVGEHLLRCKWDKIFFTGNPRVGRVVMTAAANHLTPVTLELGGKCPAIFDSFSSSWDKEMVIKRVLGGKFGACAGQACIAIDYILVQEGFAPTLLELLRKMAKIMFGENPRETKSMARIINKQHFLRLKNILDDPSVQSCIVHGGGVDEDNLFMEPTILMNPPLKASIMTDEIFGPLLPIITLKKIEDSIEFINSRPKALAIYVFTKNETLKRRIISETSSGSVTFNDAIIQYAADTIPFGGVGESGFGRYHGKFSFDTFTHEKAILRRSLLTEFWFRFPPWNDFKLALTKSAYNFDYFGFLLVLMGLKKNS
ncbi:hypothetical protein AAG906_032456 [Vitis piasezkii]